MHQDAPNPTGSGQGRICAFARRKQLRQARVKGQCQQERNAQGLGQIGWRMAVRGWLLACVPWLSEADLAGQSRDCLGYRQCRHDIGPRPAYPAASMAEVLKQAGFDQTLVQDGAPAMTVPAMSGLGKKAAVCRGKGDRVVRWPALSCQPQIDQARFVGSGKVPCKRAGARCRAGAASVGWRLQVDPEALWSGEMSASCRNGLPFTKCTRHKALKVWCRLRLCSASPCFGFLSCGVEGILGAIGWVRARVQHRHRNPRVWHLAGTNGALMAQHDGHGPINHADPRLRTSIGCGLPIRSPDICSM